MKDMQNFKNNNVIKNIFINTSKIEETTEYLIKNLGFSKVDKRVLLNGKNQLTLNFLDNNTPIIITEISANENIPAIQFGLDYPTDCKTVDLIKYFNSNGCIVKKLDSANGYLGINCIVVTVDSSIPDFIIPDFDEDLNDYFEGLSSFNQMSYAEYLEFEAFRQDTVNPTIIAEFLDLKVHVVNLKNAIESLDLLGFNFVEKEYNGLKIANSSSCLFELVEDETLDFFFSPDNVVFVIEAGIHFEYDGRIFTSNEIPSPSFKYLKDNDFNFINEVFNSNGETISNLAYVKDVNNLIWEIRSWIKQEDYQFVG